MHSILIRFSIYILLKNGKLTVFQRWNFNKFTNSSSLKKEFCELLRISRRFTCCYDLVSIVSIDWRISF